MAVILSELTLLTPTERIEEGKIVISDEGRILYAGPRGSAPKAEGQELDLPGLFAVPGFIDIHVHGGNGISFGASPDLREELRLYSQWVTASGVTGYLCSVAAPDAGSLIEMVGSFVQALESGVPGAEPLGLHLEGPFLNREKKGAFNPAWLRTPALEETEAVLAAGRGWIRQVTLAPELPGAREVAARFRSAGVVVALGHTNTDYETASAALRGDFNHVTHTFNAQSGFHHRAPGVFGAILASEQVTAELIGDTIHAHPGAMKVLIRCLGSGRVVLITDAMPGAGLPDGEYDLIGQKVTVKGQHATLPDGTLAGSVATMDQCVRNVYRLAGVPLAETVRMASLNPARVLGLTARLGSLAPGKDASLAVIDAEANVRLTLVRGEIAYQNL